MASRFAGWLFPPAPTTRASAGLLVLRVFAGAAMASHGWGKIQNPFHWMDKATNPAPAVFQALAAVAEFFGGLGLVLGALTVLAASGIAVTMLVALRFHVAKDDPFGKWELAALFLVVAVLLITQGPGRFSVDALVAARGAKSDP